MTRNHCLTGLAAILSATAMNAQTPVHWVVPNPARVDPGGVASVYPSARLESGWHMYSLTQVAGGPVAARITLAEGQPFALHGAPTGPTPRLAFDQNFGIEVEEYEERATFTVPVAVAQTATLGVDSIMIHVRYQVCNASFCLPTRTDTLAVPVVVVAADAASKTRRAH
jgi:DsbC/DsbD-like thiol-disulfide interchange protein